MRTILVLCLALFVAFSFGCSKKKTETPKPQVTEKKDLAGKVAFLFDPVSKQDIDPAKTQYSYEYKGVIYSFASAENMAAFKADPEKYISGLPPSGQTEGAPPQPKQ